MKNKNFKLKILCLGFFAALFFSSPALAFETPKIDATQTDYRPEVRIDIGGFIGKDSFNMPKPATCTMPNQTNCISIDWLAKYVSVIYTYGIGLAGILASAMILFGGFVWLTSFGSPEKVSKAKEYITGALTGLVLALFSYIILYTINPALVENRALVVSSVKPVDAGEQAKPAVECCCATSMFERGCTPKTCDNVCATAGRQYHPYSCSKVGSNGVTINEGECVAEQVASKCCCATDGLERGCTPTQCVQSSCTKSGRQFIPERTCAELRVTINEGACKN